MQLLKWPQEFQAEQPDVTSDRLPQDLGGDRGSLVRNDARGRARRRSRHGDTDDLIWSENVCRGDTSTRGADIESLCEFDELDPGGVDAAKKNRYLKANSRGPSALGRIQALTFLVDL
jgi:hypothetical protein